ncbi:MAG: hypothetical protein U0795_23345 [Pirellulales bacterium]
MNIEVPKGQEPCTSAPESAPADVSDESHPSLDDEQIQAAYRKAYLEQLRRRACPGCGDSDLF